MAGIYLHIPFCHQACNYCNFHYSVSRKQIRDYVLALSKELFMQSNYFTGIEGAENTINTIYFGGGTPSIFEYNVIADLINNIYKHYKVNSNIEITLEANPDDLSIQKVNDLKQIGINRLSIGVQSFFNEDLTYLNRKHTAMQAGNAILNALNAGFNNLSVDLIYGIPSLTNENWEFNISKLINLKVNHISAYALTVEPQTPLNWLIAKKKATAPSENQTLSQFETLINMLTNENYQHYEISNFAKPNYQSKHNTAYWNNLPYLGVGSSAHSFNLKSRQWNVRSISEYIKSINSNIIPFEIEYLSEIDKYNEYILTHLRTSWGCDINEMINNFGSNKVAYFKQAVQRFLKQDLMQINSDNYVITHKGKFIADYIMSSLFYQTS